ncbi:peptidoglycan-binding protein [Streptomonospora sp. PA3]|uniref:peptidoglycan-binding domain-containing protein n=1 Tax=Streptomonospora sp. PA3 TaxID=2607326 RepID=UPI0016424891|nr:peptidoglycan-binding protein [Streptomonospora sp. PA3]
MAPATGARRVAAVIASAGLALAAGFGAAPAASADRLGEDNPQLQAEINALPWPTYTEGDTGFIVRGIQYLMTGANKYDPGGNGYDGVYDTGLSKSVTSYQKKNDIPLSGDVGIETWAQLRDWYGQTLQGSRGPKVAAVQSMLVERGHLKESGIDGIFGPVTERAVKRFQRETCNDQGECLDDDGIVGPLTFRALVAGGI